MIGEEGGVTTVRLGSSLLQAERKKMSMQMSNNFIPLITDKEGERFRFRRVFAMLIIFYRRDTEAQRYRELVIWALDFFFQRLQSLNGLKSFHFEIPFRNYNFVNTH